MRLGTTSLTGSYCASQTLTPTSTASHNNRYNGWYQDGEALIRHRARSMVKISYLEDGMAMTEAAALLQGGHPFVSLLEKAAYERLQEETRKALASGRTRPYRI